MSNSFEIPRTRIDITPKPREVYRIKILSMGDGGVGKSCLIKRYCEEKYISTIGVDYGVKKVIVNSKEVKVNFWDLAGHPEFFDVRNEFYKDAQGGILVFDVTSRKSFEALDNWYREAVRFGAKDISVAVCANKVDLQGRSVSEKEGRAWAQTRSFPYFEVSACSGENVKDMFQQLFAKVLAKDE